MSEKLESARELVKVHERTIRTLTETNAFLISQLHKND